METRKLYYENCHLSRFEATVLACEQGEHGYEVVLNATAFYPEGGGQASDTGTLGGARVLHVREEGENILHLCDAPLAVGTTVEGTLDYGHRFRLMQQHTGEHIVSGIIHKRYGYHNVGFHMSSDVITIDFDGVIPAEDLPAIEAEANRAVWQNLAVKCFVPDPEELKTTFYRTKKDLPWPVRIVQVPGFDSCACCGVHVANTGEIGLIKLFTTVGLRGGTRMDMACGAQALEALNRAYEQNRQVSQAFSAQLGETGEAARRMNETVAQLKYRITGLERKLFGLTAQSYAGRGDVLHFAEDLEPAAVRDLADMIAEVCGGTASVFSGTDGEGYSFCLVTRSGDLRQLGKDMTRALTGRGGGKPIFQQGKVMATREQIEQFFGA